MSSTAGRRGWSIPRKFSRFEAVVEVVDSGAMDGSTVQGTDPYLTVTVTGRLGGRGSLLENNLQGFLSHLEFRPFCRM